MQKKTLNLGVSHQLIEKFKQLHQQGVVATDIIKPMGIGRPTVNKVKRIKYQ